MHKNQFFNSSLFSIPNYVLTCYPISDLILDKLTRLARDFFWSKSSNQRGTHFVAWSIITLEKSEGGLGIRDLKHAKTARMAKNIFLYYDRLH